MLTITQTLEYTINFAGSKTFLLLVATLSLFFKGIISATLISQGLRAKTAHRSWILLVLVLISSMMANSTWIFSCSNFPNLDYRLPLFWSRIAWAFAIMQYQALALFIEILVEKHKQLKLRQKIFIFISCLFSIFFVGLAIFDFNCYLPSDRPFIEFKARHFLALYALFPLMLTSIFFAIQKLRTTQLPQILRKQLRLLLKWVIVPMWLSDFIQIYPLSTSPLWDTNSYFAAAFSMILITYAAYYCVQKIIKLRFLNLEEHVRSDTKFNFINNFKDILEQLSQATSVQEIRHITQAFFKDAFGIPLRSTTLHIRNLNSSSSDQLLPKSHTEIITETFLSDHNKAICSRLQKTKILIYDELEFSYFYEKNTESKAILTFMENIDADVFIPIYQNERATGYIIVDRDDRSDTFYSEVERDEMLVFASYVGNIINLLQNRNIETIIHREKKLQEELYHKHQEINQYKESIRSFLRSKEKAIGILFYKNRRFVFGNHVAKELISIDVNKQDGHPLTKALKLVARQVEEYKSAQTILTNDIHGNKLVLSGVPNLEQNNVIISVYHPEISDIIKKQIDLLKNPTQWDYLLYLETTKSGQLISRLIPGSGETLLNFKIDLLKIALSKKARLLKMPKEDLLPTVELLHHISLREALHVLNLEGPEKNFETATKLFGINPIFGINSKQEPLLKKLDNVGTLFIKNIQFLELETQKHLAEYIRYGFYRIFKSDQKVSSSVRIICSTNQDLQALVQEGIFSKELFNELKSTSLSMPSLLTLPEKELEELAGEFSKQAIKSKEFNNLLELTDREKHKIAHQRPISLQEMKTRVQLVLVQKSKRNDIYQETQFDPAYDISDPELATAARLGKQALKDPRMMALLWKKFKNQNKIATFLDVNRSSVNRRCKEYKLI